MNIPSDHRKHAHALIGQSSVMEALRTEIASAARTDAKVLLLGETGVGKEVVARLIHAESARRRGPFIAVNCSGIPETLLESELFGHVRGSFTDAHRDKAGLVRQAECGTLLLDELGEMSLRMQAVLLRFTETGELQPIGAETPAGRADVRLITATNRDLRAQIAAGAFREDLYYRLNVIQIYIPPLRDRGDDILLLLAHYLEKAAQAYGVEPPQLTPDAAQLLLAYRWPGNVRELRNVTERLVVRHAGRPVMPDDLPEEIRSADPVAASIAISPRVETPLSGPTVHGPVNAAKLQALWDRLEAGEDFWTVVHQAFKARELTRAELAALVDRGLQKRQLSNPAEGVSSPPDRLQAISFVSLPTAVQPARQTVPKSPSGPVRAKIPSRAQERVIVQAEAVNDIETPRVK